MVAWKGGQATRKREGGPWWHRRVCGQSAPLWERSPSFEGAATALDVPTADSVACACMCEWPWPSSSPPKTRSEFSMMKKAANPMNIASPMRIRYGSQVAGVL